MTGKRIYLDVDGVIAPYDPLQRAEDWHYRTTRVAGMHIWYSPNLVAALIEIPAEIVWLTSWENHAAQELAPEIGLPHYRALHPPTTHDGGESGVDWWKLAAIRQDKPTNFYWIDDELGTEITAQSWVERAGSNWISPNRYHGLTPALIQQLTEWATHDR